MSRTKFISNLIKEGFNEKTLAKFTDKQISDLHERIVNEQGQPNLTIKATDLPKTNPASLAGKTVRVVPEAELKEKKKLSKAQSLKMDTDKDGDIDAKDLKNLRNKKKEVKESEKNSESTACKKYAIGCYASKGKYKVVKDVDLKESEKKPSAGLTKKQKSEVVKKAKKGGAKNPKAVAAAAMWKNVKRKKVNENAELNKWLDELINENYHPLTTKGEIINMIKQKLK